MSPNADFKPQLGPARLSHLAGGVVLRCLAAASVKLDSILDTESNNEISQQDLSNLISPPPGTQQQSSMNRSEPSTAISARSSSAASEPSELSLAVTSKVVRNIMLIKSYIRRSLPKKARLELLQLAATFAVMSSNIPVMRFVMNSDVETLDFTGSDCWPLKRLTLSDKYKSAMLDDQIDGGIVPPNEFDWYSADRMGRIITMNEALELFSIISSSHCMEKLKRLRINVRRASFWPCRRDSIHVFDGVYTKLHAITELVIRGMADDNLLKIVGKSYLKLKLLDVSFSKFVTDQGIRNLFFDEIDAPAILFTLPSWIQHSAKMMNPVSRSLEVFDFSHTKVTWDSVTMLSCCPGAYVFKRNFASGPNAAFGHAIFIRKQPEHSVPISKDVNAMREALHTLSSTTKAELFKLLETDLWNGCHLHTFKGAKPNFRVAFVISSKDEKFIQGYMTFCERGIKLLYSASPISMDILGSACTSLESLQTVMMGKWTHVSTAFSILTCVDIFAGPYTLASVLRQCHNLIKVRFRVVGKPITDEDIIGSVSISGCKETLQEFWVAPGSYKVAAGAEASENDDGNSAESIETSTSSSSQSQGMKDFCSKLMGNGEEGAQVEDLCKLSIRCACKVVKLCPKLRRLGDLTWWSLTTATAVSNLCHDLKTLKLGIVITFDDILLPDFELPKRLKRESTPVSSTPNSAK